MQLYTEVASTQYSIIKIFLRVFIINHFLACGWYGVGIWDPHYEHSWVKYQVIKDRSFSFRYTASLHWALAQLGVGAVGIVPTNTGEMIYATAVLFLALLMFSTFLSSIVCLVRSLQELSDMETKLLFRLRRLCTEKGVSKDLAVRLRRFVQNSLHERPSGDLNNDLLQYMSEPLQAELLYEIFVPILELHPFFGNVSASDSKTSTRSDAVRKVMHVIAKDAVVTMSLGQKDVVFCGNDVATSIYFLEQGRFEYIRSDVPHEMHPGQWMSEPVLWTTWLHLGILRTLMPSQIVTIREESFPHIMSMHPTTWAMAHKYAVWFVSQLNKIDAEELSDLDTNQEIRVESEQTFNRVHQKPKSLIGRLVDRSIKCILPKSE
jgi:voltage-gated potassium channel